MKPLFVLLYLCLCAALTVQVAAQDSDAFRLVDDFERGVPFNEDSYGNGIGLIPWGDQQGNVTLGATQVLTYSPLILPDQEAANTVLTVDYDISGWGGFTHAFTNGDDWITQDWSGFDAFQFWLYGNNTGEIIQIDLLENRTDETFDTAERFAYEIEDDYTGWRLFTISFSDFKRRTDFQPSGAPNDRLTLEEVSGYAFIFPAGVGAQVAYLDDVMLVTDEYVEEQAAAALETEEAETVSEPVVHNWTISWSDEFDGEVGQSPNPENWTCEIGGQGWGNEEWEYYTSRPENVSLNGEGNLVITAREESPGNSRCWYGECEYTSARCITENKVEFTYGRVEARIQIPYGQGLWPAFWMLGADFREVDWPTSGEIDIMESVGKEPRTVRGTIHGPGYSGGNSIGESYLYPENLANDYHIYAVEWEEGMIRWYLDDILYHTVTPEDVGRRRWVFDHDFFILLNVAVGGLWPGYPDETTTFPQTMKIDYVRVYQDAPESE
jgi:beta-glucanase (GH16 family)